MKTVIALPVRITPGKSNFSMKLAMLYLLFSAHCSILPQKHKAQYHGCKMCNFFNLDQTNSNLFLGVLAHKDKDFVFCGCRCELVTIHFCEMGFCTPIYEFLGTAEVLFIFSGWSTLERLLHPVGGGTFKNVTLGTVVHAIFPCVCKTLGFTLPV
jgi:hypothetical protein